MKSKWYFLPVLFSLAASVWLAWQVHSVQKDIEQKEAIYAEIHRINYGLFNMQAWKEKAFYVFTGHISQFKISPSAYKEAEEELRKYLYSVYDKYIADGSLFNDVFDKAEKGGKVNKMILKLFKDNIATQVEGLNIKAEIPSMAKQLAAELRKNEPRFQELMQQELVRLLQYKDKYSYKDPRQAIFDQLGYSNAAEARTLLKNQLTQHRQQQYQWNVYLMVLVISTLIYLTLLYLKSNAAWAVGGMTLFSMLLLALGISLPMIVIDARLNSFVFNLFEQDLSFDEQIVFYQSKSILDVTQNLIESSGLDLKLVGVMILCFSVIFPLIKLVLGGLFLQYPALQNSKFARNTIFYLGKWSMADVFVVALFMAYIGFYGLFDAQLNQLENNKGGFAIETVNYTHLSAGALFFTTYCLLSIVLGLLINQWHTVKMANGSPAVSEDQK